MKDCLLHQYKTCHGEKHQSNCGSVIAPLLTSYFLPHERLYVYCQVTNTKTETNVSFTQVTTILNAYLSRFAVAPIFSEEEVEHYFMPIEDVVDTHVVEGPGELCLSFPMAKICISSSL